jgi:hypothetical protein
LGIDVKYVWYKLQASNANTTSEIVPLFAFDTNRRAKAIVKRSEKNEIASVARRPDNNPCIGNSEYV